MGESIPGLGPHLHIWCRDLAYLTGSSRTHASGLRLMAGEPNAGGCTRPGASTGCTPVRTVLRSTEPAVPAPRWDGERSTRGIQPRFSPGSVTRAPGRPGRIAMASDA